MDYYLGNMSGERSERRPDAPLGACGITHDCPFCGKRASTGRVVNWIAGECLLEGEAVFPCPHCGQSISVPAAIFLESALQSLRRECLDEAAGWIDQRALFQRMVNLSARELLVPDWGEVILKWNKKD